MRGSRGEVVKRVGKVQVAGKGASVRVGEAFFGVIRGRGIDTQGPRCAATKPNLHVRTVRIVRLLQPGQKSNEPGLCDLCRDMTSAEYPLGPVVVFTMTPGLV